jgi:hypothetical protein
VTVDKGLRTCLYCPRQSKYLVLASSSVVEERSELIPPLQYKKTGWLSKYNVDSVYIDGANPSFIRSLKLRIGEDPDYDKVIARYKAEGLGDSWTRDMCIVPVNFNKDHKPMLGHCKMILESEGGCIAINPDKFDKLITALRTAVDIDGTLDKEATSYNDIFDAYRLRF